MEKIKLMLSRVKRFLREAKVELKKVTWPTPKEALASTSVVIVVVIIVSIFLGVVDLGLTKIIRLVLG
ncbi:MAG: preprotein translocase subunit SecE [Thermodesulfobacteriota bacterium]|nr:preprotein translocase subunit SecE [Thermodesulfobacteriota bacterium]